MTQNLADLRSAMNEYADQAAVPPADVTVDAVRLRVRRGYRRRYALLAAAAAVIVAAGTVLGLNGIGSQQSSPTPAQLNRTHHTHFLAYVQGYRLTNIVDVPLGRFGQTASDKVTARIPATSITTSDARGHHPAVSVLLPLATDHDGTVTQVDSPGGPKTIVILGASDRHDVVRNTGLFPPLHNGIQVPSGTTVRLAAITRLAYPRQSLPVAVYSPVPWNQYPLGKAPFSHLPSLPQAADGSRADGSAHVYPRTIVHSGSRPTATVRVNVTWPRDADVLDILPLPTTTGRFRISVDGHPQVCGSLLRPSFWCSFYDSNLSWGTGVNESRLGKAAMRHTRHVVTVQAQGVTGPWRVVLTPMHSAG